ncbi:hypothetical protein BDN72DRAFT_955187 [Pluteus cervinus]|uniref:Uncharacterized protein n=1 Tax=Pluteus cervinus TaxID=181527 RepID=A0ACD3BC10_9AGAR|nr:hypothetical protein BDN72DRAFT_955187 [Pluteus cervinus]
MSTFIFAVLALAPLANVAVRHRAEYYPKSKDDSENDVLRVRETRFTLRRLVKKVWEKEGLEGFYKGSALIMLNALLPLFTKFFVTPSPITIYANPSLFFNMLYIPFLIISYRSVTTPHFLPLKKPLEIIKNILTSQERRRPYILYFTPGLVIAFLLSIGLQCFLLLPLRNDVWRMFKGDNSTANQIARTVADLTMVIITTLILCPIDVVITRLVLQRNYGGPRFKKLPQLRWPRRTTREPAATENTIPAAHQVGEKDIEMAVDEDGEVDIGTLRTPTTAIPIIPSHPQPTVPPTSGSAKQENSEDEEDAEELQREMNVLDSIEDPVVRYRKEPYVNFVDCIKSIVREEGVMTLYRAWWLTMMGQLFQPEVHASLIGK